MVFSTATLFILKHQNNAAKTAVIEIPRLQGNLLVTAYRVTLTNTNTLEFQDKGECKIATV